MYMNSLDFASPIFYGLPKETKRSISKADVLFILNLEQSYYRKATSNVINTTAFMSVSDYIMQESRVAGEEFSYEIIEEILAAKEKIEC
jgi:hypothetical protein